MAKKEGGKWTQRQKGKSDYSSTTEKEIRKIAKKKEIQIKGGLKGN